MKSYGFNLSEILEDIDNWLKEESEKEEYLEVEFRGRGKKFEFEVIEFDK